MNGYLKTMLQVSTFAWVHCIEDAYYDRSCFARFWAARLSDTGPGDYQSAESSAIFIHHSLEGADFESCIYAEVAGVLGLSTDPKRQTCLFSKFISKLWMGSSGILGGGY
ncbi:MAG: hypothetical protein P8Q92_08220 [Pseudoprimorskyibacter sp.]|nr:hypothetical protein [Pseudoprimorskyibacter sp.]